MEDDDLILLSALQHYLYCPRQCALIHLEQQWAENRQTAEGRLLHERADQPMVEKRRGVRTVSALPLAAVPLGIAGVADIVEFHLTPQGEQAYPVEYKRGRPKAHRADEVQLCAQALCLEYMLGQSIEEGALYYGQTRRRQRVVFDDVLRVLTLDTIAAVRSLLDNGRMPRAQYDSRRCDACSLIDCCQPQRLGQPSAVDVWLHQQWET
ncbi:MAG: CRISPR-associated protein Cas4 [Paludibacterium sp.]|uniref:CRISPR-associated protein Cas4 n=1 Tax=Paludibacterium sp. TaxID=1917523 RepID=UPI0025E878A2|nr:CRISPR-associated protein Cas4 [Paludibacterium sp.]MBV8048755.1 CRISPR-associated protein Cas4 [Paludibacterium sp.]MBV8648871.1 CRISPR-associated protein Cas4 [Paludibacterium sp.]